MRRNFIIWLRVLFRKLFRKLNFTLTWRHTALLAVFTILSFSASVIVLELLPSRWPLKPTFVATLETQNLTLRNGQHNSNIAGISGSQISLRDVHSHSSESSVLSNDLTQLSQPKGNDESVARVFTKASEGAYLELDSFLIPARQAVELSSSGQKNFMSLQIVEDEDNIRSEVSLVWNGEISDGTSPISARVGSERWEANVPLVEIENAEIDGLIYSPITVTALSTERLRLSGSDQIATSSLLSGEIQIYVGSYPRDSISLSAGEFTKFTDLDAQLTNLELTDSGLKFVLVGEASAINVGFLNNLRDITPSLLDGLMSIPSLQIILSAFFTLIAAGVSAINLSQKEDTDALDK